MSKCIHVQWCIQRCSQLNDATVQIKHPCRRLRINLTVLNEAGFNNNNTVHPWMHSERQVSTVLWWINNIVMIKQRTTCNMRSVKHFMITGLKKTTRTVSHLADSNCPLPEPSGPAAAQQGVHCSMRGSSLPCWWSCLVSEPPPMQLPLMKTLGTWTNESWPQHGMSRFTPYESPDIPTHPDTLLKPCVLLERHFFMLLLYCKLYLN